MRKQRAGSFVIRPVVILLILAIGVVIFLALLPQLFSNVTYTWAFGDGAVGRGDFLLIVLVVA
jgi:hypothetical protein